MLGAIAGDVLCSIWEGGQCTDRTQPLLTFGQDITDDSVCTIAIADALLHGRPVAEALKMWAMRYPGRGYGSRFHNWAHSDKTTGYGSFANGAAMRISAAGWLSGSLEEVLETAKACSVVTHDHPEAIRGAQAIAASIWWARTGMSAEAIRNEVRTRFGYPLNTSVAALSENYGFSVLAEETVPEALEAVLSARSYTETLLNVRAIGGDTDTIACMAGGISEALHGMPPDIVRYVRIRLSEDMQRVVDAFYHRLGLDGPHPEKQPAKVSPTAHLPIHLRAWETACVLMGRKA